MEKKLTTAFVVYITIGMLFAIIYALFYHWPSLSFFSPGFYVVILTWPFQLPGLIIDFQYYGFSGKVL